MEKRYYRQWLLLAPLGLATIGLGLSLFGEATTLKGSGAPFWHWFAYGTVALVVVNAGVSVFGRAVINRAKWEWRRDNKNETNERA